MKILFVTNLSEHLNGFFNIWDVKAFDCSGRGLDYPLSLLKELARHAIVEVYSPPLKGKVVTQPAENPPNSIKFVPQWIAVPETTDIEAVAARDDYDVVLLYAESMFTYTRNWDRLKAKKVIWFLSSPQQILLPQYANLKADLALKVVDRAGLTDFSEAFTRLGIRTEWLPLSVDTKRFRKLDEPKKYDVGILGNLNPLVYPLRLKAYEYLMRKGISLALEPRFGEEYVKAINQSRFFLTCSGRCKFPVMKYFEAMACGVPLLADESIDAVDLGFQDRVNYLRFEDEKDLQEKLDWASTHVGETDALGHAGLELVKQHHSNMVRARELFGMLESL